MPSSTNWNIIEDAAVLCLEGKIVSVGRSRDALRDSWLKKNREMLSKSIANARLCFRDSSTPTPIRYSSRRGLIDFEKRVAGATYEEIAEAGGGIRSSVEGVRKAGNSRLSRKRAASAA